MKKILSILLAVVMVFSLVVVTRVPTASAAIQQDIFQLGSVDAVTNLPSFQWGTTIYGKTYLPANSTDKVTKLELKDQSGNTLYTYDLTSTPVGAGVTFSIFTSISGKPEGKYTIVETTTSTTYSEDIYLYYRVSVLFPSATPNAGDTAVVQGFVYDGRGYGVNGVTVVIAKKSVSGSTVTWTAVNSGTTANSPGGAAGFFQVPVTFTYGTYGLFISDGYAPDATTTNWTWSTSSENPFAYKTWTISPGALTVTPVIDPTLVYANSNSEPQHAYFRITDAKGNAVDNTVGTHTVVTKPSGSSVSVTYMADGVWDVAITSPNPGQVTVKMDTTTGATATFSVYVKTLSPDWNPTVVIDAYQTNTLGKIFDIDGGLQLKVIAYIGDGSTSSYVLGHTPGSTPIYHFYGEASGPVDDGSCSLDTTDPTAPFAETNMMTITTGGQITFDLTANLWTKNNPLLAKSKEVKQTFKVNPTITGDVVDFSPTSVTVGSAVDFSVTVKLPTGDPRNNAVVYLFGPSGMFSGPTNAPYYVDPSGAYVYLDASGANVNIVNGVYNFPGLTFNKSGYVKVLVKYWDGNKGLWFTTADLLYALYVAPKTVTLTSDITKMVAGQIYPVVNVKGGVPGLTFYIAYDNGNGFYTQGTIAPVDNGDGTYTFSFANGVPDVKRIRIRSNTVSDTQTRYQIVFDVVKPEIEIYTQYPDGSTVKDGLITDSLLEKVVFKLKDPLTGEYMKPSDFDFVAQYNKWELPDLLDTGTEFLSELDNLQVSQPFGAQGSKTIDIDKNYQKICWTYGNPYIDYSVDKPVVGLSVTLNGTVFFVPLTVADAQITVSPKDLKLYYNQANMFSVTALDAHGKPVAGASVYGTNPYQAYSTYQFGGITGSDGVVAFSYTPNYIGQVYIEVPELNITISNGNAYVVQIVPAPKDTTPPTLTITAPADKSTVDTPTVKVTGKATDNVGVTMVAVNDVPVTLLPDGTFATTVTLTEGENTIVVKAFDAAGNVATQTLTVTYKKPAPPAPTGTKIVLKIGSDIMAVNDKVVQLDAAPEIKEGRTFLPLRAIAEAFGAQITWVPETQGITVVLGDNQIGLQIGNNTAVVNGNVLSIVPPYIKNGRTMVPIRVIAEGFGAKVEWDPINYIITITMP